MFEKLQSLFEKLSPSEKFQFKNGEAVMLDAGHDMVESQWDYGLFYPSSRKSVKVYKWHRLLPQAIIPAEEAELNLENNDSAIAGELLDLLDKHDLVPVINASR
jgi:hypothetical protein